MILDVIQSKLETLREMNNSGNIDSVKMDVILDELELLSKIIAYPSNYKVKNDKWYYDSRFEIVETPLQTELLLSFNWCKQTTEGV